MKNRNLQIAKRINRVTEDFFKELEKARDEFKLEPYEEMSFIATIQSTLEAVLAVEKKLAGLAETSHLDSLRSDTKTKMQDKLEELFLGAMH